MSSKFAETNRTAGPPLVPTQIDERASKKLEGRISLWASKAAANERNSSITERRFSLHINRRSHQSLHGPTPSQDAIDEERAEPYPGDEEQLLKEEEPMGDDEQVVFTSEFHEEMYILVHSHAWVLFILCVVLVNTAALILLAAINIKARAGWYMELLESVFIGIFLTESVIELYVYRFRYFFSVWHVMDFLIVVLNIVDLVLAICNINVEAYGATTVFRLLRIMRSLRALRVLRVLQPFKFFSTLRVILVTIERSAIPMGIIAVMMFYIIYLFSVIGKGLYGELDWHFDSIANTMFTLYLMLTLDDWFFIPMAIEAKGVYHNFYYLFVYIFVNVYILLDLFVAVIVDNFEDAWLEEKEFQREKKLKHTGSFSNLQEELEEHDEEESLINAVISVDDEDSEFDPNDDDDVNGRTIKDYYPDASEGEQRVLESFFAVAAALENSYFKLMEMQHVLDMMVDVAADSSEDAS